MCQDYARAYIRLSLLGVNNINELTECTKVLPSATRDFQNKDQNKLDKWLSTHDISDKSKDVSSQVEVGNIISIVEEQIPPIHHGDSNDHHDGHGNKGGDGDHHGNHHDDHHGPGHRGRHH